MTRARACLVLRAGRAAGGGHGGARQGVGQGGGGDGRRAQAGECHTAAGRVRVRAACACTWGHAHITRVRCLGREQRWAARCEPHRPWQLHSARATSNSRNANFAGLQFVMTLAPLLPSPLLPGPCACMSCVRVYARQTLDIPIVQLMHKPTFPSFTWQIHCKDKWRNLLEGLKRGWDNARRGTTQFSPELKRRVEKLRARLQRRGVQESDGGEESDRGVESDC